MRILWEFLRILNNYKLGDNSIQFYVLYKIFTLYILRQEYTNKEEESEEEGKKKFNGLDRSVRSGQWSLAFELTTAKKQIKQNMALISAKYSVRTDQ